MCLASVSDQPNESIVIRLWEQKWEYMVCRENDIAATKIFNARGVSPKIYCFFKNGVCMDFIRGERFDWDDIDKAPIRDPKLFR